MTDEDMIDRVGELSYEGLAQLHGQERVEQQMDYIKRKYSDLPAREYDAGGWLPH